MGRLIKGPGRAAEKQSPNQKTFVSNKRLFTVLKYKKGNAIGLPAMMNDPL